MKLPLKAVLTALSAAIVVACFAPAAHAGCGDVPFQGGPPTLRQAQPFLIGSDYRQPRYVPVSDTHPAGSDIVGMWYVDFRLPDGTQTDWGYAQWHSDGTESMNSGAIAPASGNVCMGVWSKIGPSTYKLKHVAFSYNQSTGALVATVIIRQQVTVDRQGMHFAGTFTLDAFDPAGNPITNYAGAITGDRVTTD